MFSLSRSRISTVEAVLRDLASPDAKVRIDAADHASLVVSQGSQGPEGSEGPQARAQIISALSRALDDANGNVRAACALALADLRAHEALPALLVAADDDVPLVRQLAITALGEIGDARARERMRRALRDERPEVRFQAIVAFPRLAIVDGDETGRADAWQALRDALEDDDAQVRGRAAEACGELADGAPLEAEIGDRLAALVLPKHPSDVRVAAAIALAESGDRRGARVLIDVMSGAIAEPDPGRVQAAFELAGELNLEEAQGLATQAAFGLRARMGGDPSRRAAALVALVRLRDRRAIDLVLADLRGRSFSRRMLAIGIAGRAALAEARESIEALRRDPTLADPEAIDDALGRIDAASSSAPSDA